MLDQQDIKQIREVVREEILGTDQKVSGLEVKTSKIEQNVSYLQQDVSILKQDMIEVKYWVSKTGTQVDQMSDTLKLVVESLSTVNTKLDKMDTLKAVVENNHEPRISSLELAVKRKKSA